MFASDILVQSVGKNYKTLFFDSGINQKIEKYISDEPDQPKNCNHNRDFMITKGNFEKKRPFKN